MIKFRLGQILVIEPSEAVAAQIQTVLLQDGFEISRVTTGEQALAKVPGDSFSAAVINAVLPDMSATECIRSLLQRDAVLPCIVVAAAPTLESVIESANLGISGFLLQPLRPETLLAAVRQAAEQRNTQFELQHARLGTAQLLGILQTIDTVQDSVNNPLQALLGFAEMLKDSLPENATEASALADRVIEASWRIAGVVDKLRRVRRPVTKEWSAGETLDLEAATLPSHERRQFPRFVSVMLARLPGRTGRRWYFVEDISQGGFAIAIREPAALPDTVDVDLADPESGETYGCRAQRVWVDAKRSRAGLCFLRADPALLQRLRPVPMNLVNPAKPQAKR